jgi:hypothetical protein
MNLLSLIPFFADFHSFSPKHFHWVLRLHPKTKELGKSRFQASRLFVFYAWTHICMGMCFLYPMNYIREGSLSGVVKWSDLGRPLRTLGAVVHFLAYFSFFAILPVLVPVHSDWRLALVGGLLPIVTSSLLFGIFTQIGHLNEDSIMREGCHADNPTLRDSWAVAQIETSNNFCPQSTFWHIWSNGLNLQI